MLQVRGGTTATQPNPEPETVAHTADAFYGEDLAFRSQPMTAWIRKASLHIGFLGDLASFLGVLLISHGHYHPVLSW
jgi:hypothetical protein